MHSTHDTRRRIRSVGSTAQITRAMQMVAASKMRKAQQAALAVRPDHALLWNRLGVAFWAQKKVDLAIACFLRATDLDREPDEPADLYVNGRHFGSGRLILVDGEWALRIESLDGDGDDADQPEAVEQASSPDQDDGAVGD